ncbi:sialidase family protein [Sediminibacterium goheungense]|uniref:Putative neuraminidase n=1 Tax=Sediminibacterium goheungense TaxID=1086393 RepID=A0A4R6IX89_9BACT|nr:sialidase family protein [Sediminibacterium goheungense]TDO26505.1 putative neuraminidase [Sediminibacterium goheungense]
MLVYLRTKFIAIVLLLCIGTISIQAQQALHLVTTENIFTNAPFQSCHAATICSLNKGELMAAWFGGNFEGDTSVAIWTSFRNADGWTAPHKTARGMLNGKPYACWNPVLFTDAKGKLYLHYKVGANPRQWKAFYKTSTDGGRSWSDAVQLPDSLLGPIRSKPLLLSNGDILYPSSRESIDEKSWTAHFEKSDAAGIHWRTYSLPSTEYGIIQPTLLLYKNKAIQALFRSRQNMIVQSWSTDEGQHWSAPEATGLPNPNAGIDAATLSDGTQLLVYNPLKAGANWWEGRSVLKIAASTDGVNWKDVYTLEEHADGEYSYPAIIVDAKNSIHIVYTAKRSVIRYVQLKTAN